MTLALLKGWGSRSWGLLLPLAFATALMTAAGASAGEIVISGERTVTEPIVLESNTTLVLRDAHLTVAKGKFTNVFRAEGVTNVTIVGEGRVIVDGGEYNGLGEKTTGKNGLPPVWNNNLLLFTNVRGFRVENVHFRRQGWWALNFIGCSQGVIRNLDFLADHTAVDKDGNVSDTIDHSRYGDIRVKNADGVDIRCGCHDILIENITGFTEDDTVALTALPGRLERTFLPDGVPQEIRNITVRNVRSAAFCSNVRLLAQGGARLCDILVDGVEDTSDGRTYFTGRGEAGVNLGDSHLYGGRQPTADEMRDIVIRNVRSRAGRGVCLRGVTGAVRVENVEGFDGCPKAFSDERTVAGKCPVEVLELPRKETK